MSIPIRNQTPVFIAQRQYEVILRDRLGVAARGLLTLFHSLGHYRPRPASLYAADWTELLGGFPKAAKGALPPTSREQTGTGPRLPSWCLPHTRESGVKNEAGGHNAIRQSSTRKRTCWNSARYALSQTPRRLHPLSVPILELAHHLTLPYLTAATHSPCCTRTGALSAGTGNDGDVSQDPASSSSSSNSNSSNRQRPAHHGPRSQRGEWQTRPPRTQEGVTSHTGESSHLPRAATAPGAQLTSRSLPLRQVVLNSRPSSPHPSLPFLPLCFDHPTIVQLPTHTHTPHYNIRLLVMSVDQITY